jgi:hypothetical protein
VGESEAKSLRGYETYGCPRKMVCPLLQGLELIRLLDISETLLPNGPESGLHGLQDVIPRAELV